MIFAHRGASGYCPENTIPAFKRGLEDGAKAVEFDVQLTSDEELVIIHDYTVDRTTNGSGKVCDLTLEEIKSLDAGGWYAHEFSGVRIPTLRELFEFFPRGILMNIEIKNVITDTRNIEHPIVDLIREYDRYNDVIISSFNHRTLKKIKKVDEKIRVGILTYSYYINFGKYLENNGFETYSVHPAAEFVDQKFIKEMKSKKLKIYTYTVNDAKTADELRNMGVDGIITNYPDVVMK